ncbi:type IV pilus assembly protein PilF [Legionella lansingensis]|uniref:Fimbrial biogenesis and twitching motility protein PilF n=1 Tax=Legionella lansingensis TaxID=45067 RepID=A0A0W0VT06_9GAMM|nr:type IV pilus biogenesis/stability protein PilW [Legionella lansingensis]KTD23093.1 fimbrial biogenesis and twitching motility protein PilF [Legionella lansingensis]SNV51196.1 type IV pilus assembly protein PilF [Legionella lansingensis]
MLNVLRFLPLLSLLFLLACQHGKGIKSEETVHAQQKHNEAAVYNTQLGMAYLKQGDMPRAKRKLLAALDLAPNSADANVAMAYYLEKTGDIKEARTYYQKALSLAPNSGTQLNNYGTFLCRLGHYADAERYFLKAAKDVHYIYTAAAYENAGLCAAAIPNYSKAKNYFAKALEQDPKRKQSLYELVAIELKQKHANTALSHLQKYSDLSYNDPTLLEMAIKSARQAGKVRLAANYQKHLADITNFTDYTGARNEYNSSNG